MKVRRAYVAVSFGQMHYRYAGTTGKPVVVLLHQTPSSSAMYEQLMMRLATDFRLIAPDTPGMGMSDAVDGEMRIERLAEAIAEFLDELSIDRCLVFGHHTGASIAAELVQRHPQLVTAVAMSGPTLLDDDMKSRLPAAAAAIPVQQDGSHLLQMWRRISSKDAKASPSIIERETLNGLQLGDRYAAAYEAVIAHDFAAAIQAIECPALVFAGTDDPLYSALDGTHALLADGRCATIDNARTFVCETHSDEVAQLLRRFFPAEAVG